MTFKVFLMSWVLVCSSYSFDKITFERKVEEFKESESWAFRSIQKSLAPWSKEHFKEGFLEKQLKPFSEKELFNCAWIEIKNNKVELKPYKSRKLTTRENKILNELKRLSGVKLLPNIKIMITQADYFDCDLPLLTFAKNKNSQSILFPDFEAIAGYEKLSAQVISECLKKDWKYKKSVVFWRGSFTGGDFTKDNFLTFPRTQAVAMSKNYPHLVDARFIDNGQISADDMAYLKSLGYVSKFSNVNEALNFKYLLDIDGNSCCYSRTYWILLSNSVLLKVASENIQWYYDLLKEGIHYIKIHEDYSNLVSTIEYLKTQDKEAYQIACNSAELAYEQLSHEANLAYVYTLINAISVLK